MKITADDGSAGEQFGKSVSISGDYAIVGAFEDDDNGDRSGSAYIYTFQEMITLPDQPDFSEVIYDQQGVLNLDIIYYGVESTTTITGISMGSEYFITDFDDEIVIDPGDTVSVQITFLPDSIREYGDTLTVTTDNIYIGEKTVVVVGTGIEGSSVNDKLARSIPDKFILFSTFPNPFNSTTTIRYSLPSPATVMLGVYDLTGRRVSMLIDGYMQAGFHNVTMNAGDLPSGIYIVHLETPDRSQIGKIALIR